MQIETLKDVLHWTKEFHQHLSQCLSHCADKNTDERARMILAYLSDHEKALTKVVTGFEKSGEEHALNTWCYEYLHHHPIARHVHCDSPFAELNAEQIMEVIVDQHRQVIELYRSLASRADIPPAKELLDNLKSMEEHEMMRMSQSANRFEEM
ncbi:ATPase [Microbulbifer magnicolonia]|uniref:ATPase n=1 Tax=Microbulbifer magnicolonia TaxID=3109744 RepID=UPI002B4129CF|nr:ATPase [Microbulbifer sp. GG15]